MEERKIRAMEIKRKPFQGVLNIIRFNWHFYVLSALSLAVLIYAATQLDQPLKLFIYLVCIGIAVTTSISLLVSLYVYDLSGLYKLGWLDELPLDKKLQIVNINAGFDETSVLLAQKFKNANLCVFDFYDAEKHTEVSIKRARKAYPAYPGTQAIKTAHLPMADASTDTVFVLFSAHEIRDETERIIFFKELNRILKANGKVIITEHLRDTANFFAYNIGFMHFHSKNIWLKTFTTSAFHITKEIKITPFISTFILEKNGITS
jgi:ubiquinone/menaquinone biosynthesis C-methylase UbiE